MKLFLSISFILLVVIISVGGKDSNDEGKESSNEEKVELFQKLFKLRRAEKLAAVKEVQAMENEEKKKKMITLIIEKLFTVILKCKEILENSGYVPGISSFPEEEEIRDALSNMLENTAMLGGILLYIPDLSQPLIKINPNWPGLLGWSLMFVNQTQLLDESTYTLIDLVCQEMNYTEKRSDYVNPYRISNKKMPEPKKENIVKERKKKKKLPRGPRLSSRQFGDL